MDLKQKIRIEKYGVVLRSLEHGDIEMVRNWRNDSSVSRYMITSNYITPEMQEKWFQGIAGRDEMHFIIEYEGKAIGLYSVKDIDLKEKSAELAMYFAHEEDRNSHVPFLINFCVSDIVKQLELAKIKIFILDENKRAIRYNKFLGFKPTDEIIDGHIRTYWLDFDENAKACEKLKHLLQLD